MCDKDCWCWEYVLRVRPRFQSREGHAERLQLHSFGQDPVWWSTLAPKPAIGHPLTYLCGSVLKLMKELWCLSSMWLVSNKKERRGVWVPAWISSNWIHKLGLSTQIQQHVSHARNLLLLPPAAIQGHTAAHVQMLSLHRLVWKGRLKSQS